MVLLRFVALLIGGALVGTVATPADALAQALSDADPAEVVLVVNADLPDTWVSPAEVRRVFMLRSRFWPDGTRISPVNLPATSPLRDRFSRQILGGSPTSFAEYWKDQYFHGTQPPPVLGSEEAVLLFVARTEGAIGYVSHSLALRATATQGVRFVPLGSGP